MGSTESNGLCNCGCGPEDSYWPEATNLTARNIAHGVEGGAWACDCVDWTDADAWAAYEYLHGQEVRRRDRLREGLHLIAGHADLDERERGIIEAGRYATIARDAIAKAGLR
jgi:hypothetical protein